MVDVRRLNPRKIMPNGRYVDVDNGNIFYLSIEEIEAARLYYQDQSIASQVVIEKIKKQDNRQKRNISRNQHYNKGKHRTKGNIGKPALTMIVGGLVIGLAINSFIDMRESTKYVPDTRNEIYYEYAQKYTAPQDDVSSMLMKEPKASMSAKVIIDDAIESGIQAKEEQARIEAEEALREAMQQKEQIRKDIISKYCEIYQVNFDKVYQRLSEITNNFASLENVSDYYIQGVTCKGREVHAKSEEELFLYFVRSCKQMPGKVGLNRDGLYTNTGYTSGNDYSKQIAYYANVLGEDPCLIYAVINAESSFDSSLFNNNNNPAGLRDPSGSGWWKFSSKEEGIIETMLEFLKYRHNRGCSTLKEFRDVHAPLSDGNSHWLPNVSDGYQYAQEHYDELFSINEEKGLQM